MYSQCLCFDDKEIYEWFSDKEIYFCAKDKGMMINSQEKMRDSFEVLHSAEGLLFVQLVADPIAEGMLDPLGLLVDLPNKEGSVIVIPTHTFKGEKNEKFSVLCDCPYWWFQENKNKPGIRNVIEKTLKKHKSSMWTYEFEEILYLD